MRAHLRQRAAVPLHRHTRIRRACKSSPYPCLGSMYVMLAKVLAVLSSRSFILSEHQELLN